VDILLYGSPHSDIIRDELLICDLLAQKSGQHLTVIRAEEFVDVLPRRVIVSQHSIAIEGDGSDLGHISVWLSAVRLDPAKGRDSFDFAWRVDRRWLDGGLLCGLSMPEEDLSEFAIKVKMLFFGPLAEKLGEREIEVALMHGSSARDLIERFHFEPLLATGLRIAVDGEIGADLDAPLRDASEVAFLPPMSGG